MRGSATVRGSDSLLVEAGTRKQGRGRFLPERAPLSRPGEGCIFLHFSVFLLLHHTPILMKEMSIGCTLPLHFSLSVSAAPKFPQIGVPRFPRSFSNPPPGAGKDAGTTHRPWHLLTKGA